MVDELTGREYRIYKGKLKAWRKNPENKAIIQRFHRLYIEVASELINRLDLEADELGYSDHPALVQLEAACEAWRLDSWLDAGVIRAGVFVKEAHE